jgi:hypothetical protein
MHRHAGIVRSVEDPGHVTVDWLGLEGEPVSQMLGHNPVGREYPSLLLVSDEEWTTEARGGWWASGR